jgi:hypothetical protein
MCDPVTIAISLGAASLITGTVGSIASYQQQQQQVDYANQQAMAQANYQQQQALYQNEQYNRQVFNQNQQAQYQTFNQNTAIANQNLQTKFDFFSQNSRRSYDNLQSQLAYQTELNKSIISNNYVDTQVDLNKQATSRAMMQEQQRLQDAANQSAFEGQRLLASNLQAQGSILGSGRTGQGIGLLLNSADASYGRDAAMLNKNMDTAVGDYYQNSAMAVIRQLNADSEAYSKLVPEPIKPIDLPTIPDPVYASFITPPPLQEYNYDIGPVMKPVLAKGPSALGLIAGIGSSAVSAVGTGFSSYNQVKQALPVKAGKD